MMNDFPIYLSKTKYGGFQYYVVYISENNSIEVGQYKQFDDKNELYQLSLTNRDKYPYLDLYRDFETKEAAIEYAIKTILKESKKAVKEMERIINGKTKRKSSVKKQAGRSVKKTKGSGEA